MSKLRVVLADDHAVVRAGLRALIDGQDDMEVVGEAGDGVAVVQHVGELKPDVAVMDISMPGLNGVRATEAVRRDHPDVRVLVLTVHEDRGYLARVLAAGASGYVLKRAAADELVRAIRTVAAGGVYLDPSLAGHVVGSLVRRTASTEPAEAAEDAGLSEREEEVVRLLALGHTNKEIAVRLGLSIKTIETYKARSLDKLGLRSRAELVRYALQRGWLQEELPAP